MGGAIAEAYGALLEDIWAAKFNCVAPRQFKVCYCKWQIFTSINSLSVQTQVGRYAPQFVGYAQHDSQELLAFLLDGLHEDLNLVLEKPYVDMTVEMEDRSDKVRGKVCSGVKASRDVCLCAGNRRGDLAKVPGEKSVSHRETISGPAQVHS